MTFTSVYIFFSDQLSNGSYVLLGLLRMGQDSGIIRYLADAYDASQERGGVMMTSPRPSVSNVKYSRCARAYFLNCADSGTTDMIDSRTHDVIDSGTTNSVIESGNVLIDAKTIDVIDSGAKDMVDSEPNDVIDSESDDVFDSRASDVMDLGPNDEHAHVSENKPKRSQREKQWSVVALIDGNSPRQNL